PLLHDQVEAACDGVQTRVNGGCTGKDLLHTRMGAPDDHRQPSGSPKGERELVHLHGPGLLRLRGQKEESWQDFCGFRDRFEVGILPRRARDELFWLRSVESTAYR